MARSDSIVKHDAVDDDADFSLVVGASDPNCIGNQREFRDFTRAAPYVDVDRINSTHYKLLGRHAAEGKL